MVTTVVLDVSRKRILTFSLKEILTHGSNYCCTVESDACADAGDCTNTDGYNYCNGGVCYDGAIGETCGSNIDCVSTFCNTVDTVCSDGANLGRCGANSDCASGYCDLIANQCDDVPASGGGDPHYSLHFNQFLSVQSLCDLVLMSSPDAYDGLGVTIHARHAAPLEMNAGDEYTFISNLVLQIGKERWEVQADGAKIFKDGEEYKLVENEARSGEGAVASGGFPYTVQMTAKGSRKNQIEYEFLFADRSKIVLRANRHFKMAFVEVSGRFGGAAIRGFLGTPEKKGLFGRDGALIATTPESADIEAYAQEWQVMESESKIFMDKNAFPQAPHKCVFVDSGHGFLETDDVNLTNQLLRGSRRRLSEVNPEMKLAAEKACAHISESHKRHWCEEDVIKSGFEEIASEPFYGV